MCETLWNAFDESASTGYGDGKRMMPKFSGNWSDGDAVLKYYGQKLYSQLKKDRSEEGGDGPYAREVTLTKNCEVNGYVVFAIQWYGYAGGAHGGTLVNHITFDKVSGKQIKEVLSKEFLMQLQPQIRKGLCEYLQCNDSELDDQLFLDEAPINPMTGKKVIPWPQSEPYLTKDGITFTYQQYEIGCYAIGMPTFTIPYNEITGKGPKIN